MEPRHHESALALRAALERGFNEPKTFRTALNAVAPAERDAWIDLVLGLTEPPEDGPELPRGCVPYLPCAVETLVRVVDATPVTARDVFVDVGSGMGRALAVVHLLTGAAAVGLEVQPALARAARELAARLRLSRVTTLEGDATALVQQLTSGTVFFLYCPFSGERLTRLCANLEPAARARPLSVCCVDLPALPCSWLAAEQEHAENLRIYRA